MIPAYWAQWADVKALSPEINLIDSLALSNYSIICAVSVFKLFSKTKYPAKLKFWFKSLLS